MIIKVCGMRKPDNIREVSELGIDWMGFIFYPKSPRYVLKEDDKDCQLSIINCQLQKVGVFVNESQEQLQSIADRFELDYLQLHGTESPELCESLKKEGYKILKVFSVASEEDLQQISEYEGKADYFLFDTKCKEYGGSGKQFDWSVLKSYKGSTPFLLSGGINPESVGNIYEFSHPRLAGIDLNSGFETAPAQKDIVALNGFISQIREFKNNINHESYNKFI